MKSLTNSVVSLFATVVATSVLATAVKADEQQWPATYHSLGAEYSYNFSAVGNTDEGQDNLPDYSEFGVSYRRQIKSTLSILGSLSAAQIEATDSKSDTDLLRYYLSMRFHPEQYRFFNWRPFAGVGLSLTDLEVEQTGIEKSEEAFVGELGAQYLIAKDWIVELGVRSRTELDEGFSDIQAFAGVSYLWGKTYFIPADLRDNDADGIPNVNDACGGTPTNYEVDANGCPIMVDSTIYQTLYVEFDSNQSTLKPAYYNEVAKLADIMEQYPSGRMLLEGHTDSQGSDAYNMQLSFARASEIRNLLVREFNIDPRRIEASGAGESQPIASNGTEQGRAANRRVEVVVSGVFTEAVKK